MEFLTKEIWQEKEIKGFKIGKKEVKVSLFAINMFLYWQTLKIPPKTP
jgi:hypothetical protein